MKNPTKGVLVHERALHFLRETVVGSMEGVFFALISSLFVVAGAAMFLETSSLTNQAQETMAAVPAAPVPVLASLAE